MVAGRIDPEQLRTRLKDALEALKCAGAAIALHHRNAVICAEAGLADVGEALPVGPETLFEIGSITKAMTATLMMRLVAESEVDLDAPASRYIPNLKIDRKPTPDALTVRTLLDFTAGMEGDFFEEFGDEPNALEKYVEACAGLTFIHAPGEMRAYNSTAYCIAGRVIECVLGTSYETALGEQLLRPLGIQRFSFDKPDTPGWAYAKGHRWDPETSRFATADRLHLPRAMAASGAGLSMSARDLLRLGELHLSNGTAADGTPFVPSMSLDEMWTAFDRVPPHDSERLMAWVALESGDHRLMLTSGQTIDQNAALMVLPSCGFAMSVTTNGAGAAHALVATLGFDLLKELTGVQASLPLPDLAVREQGVADRLITGHYTNGTICRVQRKDTGLSLHIEEKPTRYASGAKQSFSLVPLGAARFGVCPVGSDTPQSAIEFLFHGRSDDLASHISQGGRLFARLPGEGAAG